MSLLYRVINSHISYELNEQRLKKPQPLLTGVTARGTPLYLSCLMLGGLSVEAGDPQTLHLRIDDCSDFAMKKSRAERVRLASAFE